MRAVIVGYGRMGREIEAVLKARGHSVTARVDPAPGADAQALTPELLAAADVALEFSQAAAVAANAGAYAAAARPAVVGTTGWADKAEAVRRIVEDSGIGYVYGSNFSIGAHLFFALAEQAAKMINPFAGYDVALWEMHHNQKKDSPSGTALTAGNRILQALGRKTKMVTERLDRQIAPEELHVASVRGGTVPGTHTVILDSEADSLEIIHRARNRAGFALGAVMAAEWVLQQRGFIPVESFINQILDKWR